MTRAARYLLLVLSLFAVNVSSSDAATAETSAIPAEGTVADAALENVPDNAETQEPAAGLPVATISVIAVLAILVVSVGTFLSGRGRKKRR